MEMKVTQLKAELGERGEPTSGRKPSLRLRLRAVIIADRLAEDGEEEWGEEGEASDDEEAAPWR